MTGWSCFRGLPGLCPRLHGGRGERGVCPRGHEAPLVLSVQPAAWTSDLGVGVLDGKLGPSWPPHRGLWLRCPRQGHELTVMEFEKPKPGSVESLFLILARIGEPRPSVPRGGGLRATQPARRPARSPARPAAPTLSGPGGARSFSRALPGRPLLAQTLPPSLKCVSLGVPSGLGSGCCPCPGWSGCQQGQV